MNFLLVPILILITLAQVASFASGASDISAASSRCTAYDLPGHLTLVPGNDQVPSKGPLSATDTRIVQFDRCDLPFMHYEQGSSRNSGGVMGAPLEYFGHIRYGQKCLTVQWNDSDHKQPSNLRYTPCSYANDDIQLQQWFVYRYNDGPIELDFVGAKNLTKVPYKGPIYHWDVSSSGEPKTLQVSGYGQSKYRVYLAFLTIKKRNRSYSFDFNLLFPW